jgi:hypothetical protein
MPRRSIGIGPWLNAFVFEIIAAAVFVPGLFVHVSGQLDAFAPSCARWISETFYGPVQNDPDAFQFGSCVFKASSRLIAFTALQNLGVLLSFIVYKKSSSMSMATSLRMQQHARRQKFGLRKKVRMIGEEVFVQVQHPVEQKSDDALAKKARMDPKLYLATRYY